MIWLLGILASAIIWIPRSLKLSYFLFWLLLCLSVLPLHRHRTLRDRENLIAIIDDSLSMTLEEPSRLQQAKNQWEKLRGGRGRSIFLSELTGTRRHSLLFTGLLAAAARAPSGAQIVLFSDGQAEDGLLKEELLQVLTERKQKVIAYPVGEELPVLFDLVAATLPSPLFKGERTQMRLYFHIFQAPLIVQVELLGETVWGKQSFVFRKAGWQLRELKIRAADAGDVKLQLRSEAAGEKKTLYLSTHVMEDEFVSVVCGRPHPDCGIMSRWLKRQLGIDTATFFFSKGKLFPASQEKPVAHLKKSKIVYLLYPHCQLPKNELPYSALFFLLVDKPLTCSFLPQVFGDVKRASFSLSLQPFSRRKSLAYNFRWLILPSRYIGVLNAHGAQLPYLYQCGKDQCVITTVSPLYPMQLREPLFLERFLQIATSVLRRQEKKVLFPPSYLKAYHPYRVLITNATDASSYTLSLKEGKVTQSIPLAPGEDGLVAELYLSPGKYELALRGPIKAQKSLVVGGFTQEMSPPASQPEVLEDLALRTGGKVAPEVLSPSRILFLNDSPLPIYPICILLLFVFWRKRLTY